MDYNALYNQIGELEKERRHEELKLAEEQTKNFKIKQDITQVSMKIKEAEVEEQELKKKITELLLQERENKKTIIQVKEAVRCAKMDCEIFENHVKQETKILREESDKLQQLQKNAEQNAKSARSALFERSNVQEYKKLAKGVKKLRQNNREKEGQIGDSERACSLETVSKQLEEANNQLQKQREANTQADEELKEVEEELSNTEQNIKPTASSMEWEEDPEHREDNGCQVENENVEELEVKHQLTLHTLNSKLATMRSSIQEIERSEAEIVESQSQLDLLITSLQTQAERKMCPDCLAQESMSVE